MSNMISGFSVLTKLIAYNLFIIIQSFIIQLFSGYRQQLHAVGVFDLQTSGMLTRPGKSEVEARDVARVIKTPYIMITCAPTQK